MLPFIDVPLAISEAKADPHAYRGHMMAALTMGSLLTAFLCSAELVDHVRFGAPKRAVRVQAVDQDALEAIALVQDWHVTGDEKAVAQRLASVVRNPYYPRAWSAEKMGEDSYLVIFREPAGSPVYAFEVGLESESVEATPEARDRLTILRVREALASKTGLMASVDGGVMIVP
jgi:hypothetical protein